MNLKPIKNILKNPLMILYFMDRIRVIRLPDKLYLQLMYKYELDLDLNIKVPQSFNAKLQWLKLYDRNPKYTKMVDKYEAKKYVSNIIGEEYIIPTLGIYNKFEDINFNELPNQFVIKCTHDSGGLFIVKDKTNFDINKARKIICKSLKRNYYYYGREWPYKNVKPRIIIEKYIEDTKQKDLRDYKFFCFNGEPKLMYLSEGLENHATASMSFYDMNFKLTDCKRRDYKQLNYIPEKPKTFEQMKDFSRRLSKGIPHLRVDFYEIDGHLYFGELTFSTCAGFILFEDDKWNYKLGDMLELPNEKIEEEKEK